MTVLRILDGTGYLFRSFFALPPMTRADGMPVGAVYGVCLSLVRLIQDHPQDPMLVCLDKGRRTFRHKLYPPYKTNRLEPPEDLVPQFALLREALLSLHFTFLEDDEFESDDLIATATRMAEKSKWSVCILSSDKDLMQLVNPRVWMEDPAKNTRMDAAAIFKKFGVYPRQMRDFQTLVGDSSDHVPGVRGVGPKTAATLLQTYDNIEAVYANLDQLRPALRQKLSDGEEQLALTRRLVTLREDAPVSLQNLSAPTIGETFLKFAKANQFTTFLRRFAPTEKEPSPSPSPVPPPEKVDVTTREELQREAQRWQKWGVVFLTQEEQHWVVGCGRRFCFIAHTASFRSELKTLLSDPAITLFGLHLKEAFASLDLRRTGHDVLLMAFLLHGRRLAVDTLAPLYGEPMPETPLEAHACLERIYPLLMRELLQKKLLPLYLRVEYPLLPLLLRMEARGIHFNRGEVEALQRDLDVELQRLQGDIYDRAGEVFNISSPAQLGPVLQRRHPEQVTKKTKSGQLATRASLLEKLAEEDSLVRDILLYRKLFKLRTTYTQSLLEKMDAKSVIRTTFVMTGAQTGRLSSRNPNLQNIPIREERGRALRRAVTPREGCLLVGCDYNQIELRLLAIMARSSALQEAFVHGEDVHAWTARKMFTKSDPVHRRIGKTINFGLMYGMSAHGLAQLLHIDRKEAQAFITMYFELFPEIKRYRDEQVESARRRGYVSTLFQRRIVLPDIQSRVPHRRAHAERQAINAPIQGTAADIMKWAMLWVQRALDVAEMGADIVLQIHDELLLEVPAKNAETTLCITRDNMERAPASVPELQGLPFTVDGSIGHNWEETHG